MTFKIGGGEGGREKCERKNDLAKVSLRSKVRGTEKLKRFWRMGHTCFLDFEHRLHK